MCKEAEYESRMSNTSFLQRSYCVQGDQKFHNWLVYTGKLGKYMNVLVYPLGEGPVSTIGRGVTVQGEAPNMYVTNVHGDPAPVVHQYDRHWQDIAGVMQVMNGLT